jgi:hypothetical protein
VAALDQIFERVEVPVVVVGNAYAGAVIASTIDEKVGSLVCRRACGGVQTSPGAASGLEGPDDRADGPPRVICEDGASLLSRDGGPTEMTATTSVSP